MKMLLIARKTLVEGWREPQMLALLIAFPALLILIYYIAYSPADQGMASLLHVAVVNEDRGPTGAQLVEAVRSTEWEGKPMFTTHVLPGVHEAEIGLGERKLALLLVIPPDFSAALQARDPAAPAAVRLVGDPTYDMYVFAEGMLVPGLADFAQAEAGAPSPAPRVTYESLPGTGTLSDLQYGIPGTLVFGVLAGIITAAIILVREDVRGTLARLRLTRAGAFDLLAGIALAQAAQAMVQVPLAFAVAVLLGFTSPGSLLLAMLIGVLLSMAATGLGLICACFARNDGGAAGLATACLAPMAFLSGAVFPMPAVPLGTIAGHAVSLYDLMPSAPAAEAMRRVLIFGDGPAEVGYELAVLAALSLLYLVAGVLVFQWRQRR